VQKFDGAARAKGQLWSSEKKLICDESKIKMFCCFVSTSMLLQISKK